MSFWEDVRHPLTLGSVGLGYDAITKNGLFGHNNGDPNSPYNFDGSPKYPEYNPQFDAATMSLAPELDKRLGALNLDKSALNQYQQEALRQGPSGQATLALKQQQMLAKNSKDQNAAQAASGTASEMSSLARSGGLSSGARERAARAGTNNMMDLNQAVNSNLAQQAGQIGIADEQNRTNMLGQVPGMQNQAAAFDLSKISQYGQARQGDIQNQVAENQAKNQFNLGKYDTQGKIWAAGKTSQALGSQGGGSWLCTEAHDELTDGEKGMIEDFKSYAAYHEPVLTRFYLKSCDELVTRMKAQGYDWNNNTEFVKRFANKLFTGNLKGALEFYIKHVFSLMDDYWKDCPILSERKKEVA